MINYNLEPSFVGCLKRACMHGNSVDRSAVACTWNRMTLLGQWRIQLWAQGAQAPPWIKINCCNLLIIWELFINREQHQLKAGAFCTSNDWDHTFKMLCVSVIRRKCGCGFLCMGGQRFSLVLSTLLLHFLETPLWASCSSFITRSIIIARRLLWL